MQTVLHLGHVAGNCLPADIQYRYERARGRRVLMCSGSDEHGTPITITADEMGVSPQEVVDKYHRINTQALADLGCSWVNTVDQGASSMGEPFTIGHQMKCTRKCPRSFTNLMDSGFLEKMTMQQYCSVSQEGESDFFLTDMWRDSAQNAQRMEQGVTSATPVVQHTKPMSGQS